MEGLQTSDYAKHLNQVNSNSDTLGNSINNLNDEYRANRRAINKYEDSLVIHNNKKPDINDARKEDAETYLVQQNYVYILGTITLAIVFVGAVVIMKN